MGPVLQAFHVYSLGSVILIVDFLCFSVTIPRGDIILEEGQELRIRCELNVNHVEVQDKNASSLYFVRNETEVPGELVRILNESAIELLDPAPKPSDSIYSCRFRHEDRAQFPQGVGICLNRVSVGFRPGKYLVTNISCISYNWQNLTCSWTPPQNFIKTEYQIVLYEVGKRNPYYKCPETTRRENSCTWSHSTEPMYRQAIENYNITITGINSFGKHTQYLVFNSYERVLPDKPKLSVLNKTSNSILLHWQVLFPLETFPPGLIQKVEYQPRWESRDPWHTADTSSLGLRNVNYTFHLTNLKYANTHYDIRVFMKSAKVEGDSLWSEPASVTVKTLPDVPSSPPKTDVGTFEIVPRDHPHHDRDVYVYWQQIPDYSKNGDDFEYKVIEVKEAGIPRNILPTYVTKAFAKFDRISNNAHEFTIIASNRKGRSVDSSKVFVPNKLFMPSEPVSFTKVAYDQGIYELSWKASNRHHLVDNYTIFWCDNERERPYQCEGILQWIFVDQNTFIKNVTVPDITKNYQFAISANSKDGSSGMVWAKCTIIHNKVIGKMNDVWVQKVGSTSIELGWKLDCSGRIGVLQGFRIFYCPIINLQNPECTEPQQNTTVGDQSSATIHNLRPYRTYRISVAVLTISETGALSDPIYETTLEAAPEKPPMNLRLGTVTNTTAHISWDPPPPESHNGVISYYEINYSSLTYNTSLNETEALLINLKSHKVYSVTVSACTKSCSKPSASLKFKTNIGTPGEIQQPIVRFTNSTQALVSWLPPALKGGNLDFYDIEISDDDRRNSTFIIRQANRTETLVSCPNGKTKTKEVRVRAVNTDGNMTYIGPWSSPGTVACIVSGMSPFMLGLIYIFFFTIFAGCAVWAGKTSWYRCAKMKDFDVKLPPSLNAICDDKNKEQHECSLPMQNWSGHSRKDEHAAKAESCADEELLLQKKEIGSENDDAAEDSESKHETVFQGDSPTISNSDNNHSSTKSVPKSNENYSDKKDVGEGSTSKGNSSDRDLTYCKVGGGYVSIAPISGPSSAPQPAPTIIENPYVPNHFENPTVSSYVKAFNIPNPSQLYCRIGLGPPDMQTMPDAGTKLLLNPEPRYVTVGESIKLNREKNSVST
ncbi:unnamed protein product [Bemisia tabaci]|uniref:Fibronectin type-III domain-containing protein n=1 Tax=Bemisia tabaci TaxID=7038 RepID=A0A9P0F242_BEMTA|nr:unnamed protein product [Bemisia tabaci]